MHYIKILLTLLFTAHASTSTASESKGEAKASPGKNRLTDISSQLIGFTISFLGTQDLYSLIFVSKACGAQVSKERRAALRRTYTNKQEVTLDSVAALPNALDRAISCSLHLNGWIPEEVAAFLGDEGKSARPYLRSLRVENPIRWSRRFSRLSAFPNLLSSE